MNTEKYHLCQCSLKFVDINVQKDLRLFLVQALKVLLELLQSIFHHVPYPLLNSFLMFLSYL